MNNRDEQLLEAEEQLRITNNELQKLDKQTNELSEKRRKLILMQNLLTSNIRDLRDQTAIHR